MEQNISGRLKVLVYTSLAIAMVALATLSIRIPIGKGYVNFGDILIFTTAAVLGKRTGMIAGGVGSAIADIIGGFFIFAPATFLVKGLEGLICALLVRRNEENKVKPTSLLVASLAGGAFMIAGYFVYEYFLFGFASAYTDLPGNIVQGAVSAIAAVPVVVAINKTNLSANIQKR